VTSDCVVQNQALTGTFSPSGLRIAGRVSVVSIDDTSWTPLPATALDARNAMAIQNVSSNEIKLNYDSATVGYVGVRMFPSSERFYDITDEIVIYAKAEPGAGTITIVVEELS